MAKKIYLVVEDSKKGKVKVPLTKNDVNEWYRFAFMIEPTDGFYKTLKLNKCLAQLYTLHHASAKIIDAIDEGKCYQFKHGKKIISKHKFWHAKKAPRWRK